MSSQSISFPFTSFSGGWKTHDCLGFPVPFRSNRRKGLCGIVVALKGFLKGFFRCANGRRENPLCWLVWGDVLRALLRTSRKLKLKIYFKLLECFKMKNKRIKIQWECFYLQLAQWLTQKSMTTMLFGLSRLDTIQVHQRFTCCFGSLGSLDSFQHFFSQGKKWSFPQGGSYHPVVTRFPDCPLAVNVFDRKTPSLFSWDFPETKTGLTFHWNLVVS